MDVEEEQTEENGNNNTTIMRLWRRNHNIFKGKFSSGATPKTHKDSTVKLNHTDKKGKLVFTNDNSTPRRRLNICHLLKQDLEPTISKKISKIEEVEEQHVSPDRKAQYHTPPKKQTVVDHDRQIRDSYEKVKYGMKEYDDKNSRFEHDFEEQCTLGSGYFGIVKKCRNKVDGSIYAIKIMKPFQKNLNEVKALATLSNVECGNIVRYHNSWIEDGRLFMVMEYCETSLKKVIEEHRQANRPFIEREIKAVAIEILSALESLHKNNIVHLDIKPENILLSLAGKYKLGDLGLSRIAQFNPGEELAEGDSKYLAKQLLSGIEEELPDLTKADIFSLGVTLFYSCQTPVSDGTGFDQVDFNLSLSNTPDNTHPNCSRYILPVRQIISNMTDPLFSTRMTAKQLLHRPYFCIFERLTAHQEYSHETTSLEARRLSF